MIETASVVFEGRSDIEPHFRGYVELSKIGLTKRWIEVNDFSGTPPSEVSSPQTLAFAEREIADDNGDGVSDTAVEAGQKTCPVTQEVKRAKHGLITDAINYYNIDEFRKAEDYFQQAANMKDVCVLSYDDELTDERLDLWLCLSTLRSARPFSEPHRSSLLEPARALLVKIESRRGFYRSPKTHQGRHRDALLLAEAYLYNDALSQAEDTCAAAIADIESTLGTEKSLFHSAALLVACVHFAK